MSRSFFSLNVESSCLVENMLNRGNSGNETVHRRLLGEHRCEVRVTLKTVWHWPWREAEALRCMCTQEVEMIGLGSRG